MHLGISLALTQPRSGIGSGDTYDYEVANLSELNTVLALGAATLAGKRIGVHPGVYTQPTISIQPASLTTFIATGAGTIWDRTVLSDFDNLRFEGIEFVSSVMGAENCITLGRYIGRHEFGAGYKIHGGYKAYTTPIDPTDLSSTTTTDPDGSVYYVDNRYPEQAHIVGKIAVDGTLSWLHISRKNIGTNTPDGLTDGTYSIDFSPGQFSTSPVATFTVVSGVITSTSITSVGAGGNSAKKVGQVCTWANRTSFNDTMPNGVKITTGLGTVTYAGPGVFEDGEMYDVDDGLVCRAMTGGRTIRRNDFYRVYTDVYQSANPSGNSGPETYALNRTWHPLSAYGDEGDPHSDAGQWTFNGGTGLWPVDIYGNMTWVGNCRGEIQGYLLQNPASPSDTNGFIPGSEDIGVAENILLMRSVTQGISITCPVSLPISFNMLDEWESAPQEPIINFPSGSFGTTYVEGNLAASIGSGVLSDTNTVSSLYGNSNLGATDRTTVYQDYNGAKDTAAEVLAAFAPKTAYNAKGPLRTGAPVDFSARTIDTSNLPVLAYFAPVGDAVADTAIESSWVEMLGGPATFTVVPGTGTEVKFADDSSGTNATSYTSSSTTGTRGKFVKMKRTSSATGSATVSASATFNGVTRSFSITTAATTNYPAVSNGGTAYSSIARPSPNQLNIDRILIVWEARRNGAQATDPKFFAAGTLSRLFGRVSTNFTVQAIAGATFAPTFTNTVDENWHRYHCAIDLTQTEIDLVAKCTRDGAVRLPYASGNVDVTGAVTTTSDALLAGNLGIFDEADGGSNVFVGEFRLFWMAFGNSSTFTLPDITDPSVCANWSLDNINTSTGAANGITPQYALWGDATAWNAGLANKGSAGGTLTAATGTYTDV